MVIQAPGQPAVGAAHANPAENVSQAITLDVTATTLEVIRDGESSGLLT